MNQTIEIAGKDAYLKHLPAVAKGAGVVFLGTLSGKLLTLLFTLIIAKYLSAQEVGIYFMGISIITIVTIPALLGLDLSIVRFVALYKGIKDEGKAKGAVISALIIVIPLSCLITFVLFFLSGTIANVFFHKPQLANVLKMLSLTIPFIAVSTIFLSTTQALKHMQYKVFAKDFGENMLKTLFAIALLILGFKINGVVFATVASIILVAIISFYYSNKLIPVFGSVKPVIELKNLLSFALPQSFSSVIVVAVLYIDILILGYYLPAKTVGIYSIAARVSLVGTLVIGSFNAIFAPMIADFHNRGELDTLSSLFKTITKWIFSISFPIFLLFVFLAKPILGMFGSEYIAGATALIILSVGQLINATSGPVGLMIVMSGRPSLELISNVLVFVLNIILNLILIPKYAIVGAAIATAISIAAMNIFRLMAVLFIMHIHPYRLSFYKPLLAGFVPSLIVFLIGSKVGSDLTIVQLLIFSAVFLLFYLFCLYIFGIDSEESLIIKNAVDKLPFSD